jgi:hypothetical protein
MKNPRNWNIGNHNKHVEELRQKLKNINMNFKNSNQYQYTNLRRKAATLIRQYLYENLGITNFHPSVMRKLNVVKNKKRERNMQEIKSMQGHINSWKQMRNSAENVRVGGQANNSGYNTRTQNEKRKNLQRSINGYESQIKKLKNFYKLV